MFGIEEVPLVNEKGKKFFYRKRKVQVILKRIEELLEENNELMTKVYLPIRKNNSNMVDAFSFIQRKLKISKETVKKLHDILMEKKEELFYRDGEVYILNNFLSHINILSLGDFDKGMPQPKVEESMNSLFAYLEEEKTTKYDSFFHSQIAHFYFVYVHPYNDGNGRSARLLSSWYLLRNNKNPYTIFLRGIEFNKEEYLRSIRLSRKGNITPFLEYISKTIEKELKKEIIIKEISSKVELTEEDKETLLFLLSTKNMTIGELQRMFEIHKKLWKKEEVANKILSLVEKDIIYQEQNKIIIRQPQKEKEYRRKYGSR